MLSTYDEHMGKVESIRSYINSVRGIALIPTQYPEENAARALLQFVSMPQKRSYDYSLIIITLYGIVESFIEELLRAYLRSLSSKINQYSDLPDTIVSTHIELSARLIGNNSPKYENIAKKDIISNLNSCINQVGDVYKLNVDAYTQHSSNYRIDTIHESFKSIGIDNIRESIKKNPAIISFLVEEEGYGREEIDALPDTKFFEILDDLVQRRNVIAHGSKIDDLLSLEILEQYSKYIISIMKSIYMCVSNKFYEIMTNAGIAKKLGEPKRVIDNRIICINNANLHIKIGQVIIGKNGRGSCFWGMVESMQLDGVNIGEIGADMTVDIGMGISFKAKESYTYYIYPNE